ncbi:hypothetical protein [Kocuria palustris]|uniref:hypothetical protein n=1 Tax=Kocuria palustris TaxID=71999 RepID=UPI0011A421FC|nr:hypothetical protein [Kocuria palustris]
MRESRDPQARARGRSPVDVASVPVSAVVSVVSGLLAGILGTVVHGNILRLGGHLWIPWGAVLALALLLSLSVWSGTTTRRIWASAVPGIVAYAAAFVLAFGRPDSPLVVMSPGSAIGISGLLWFGGILVVTLLSVVLVGRWWRQRRRAAARQAADEDVARETREASERVSAAAPAEGPAGRA